MRCVGAVIRVFVVVVVVVTAVAPNALGAEPSPPSSPPPGMRWIPGGEFAMGTDDARSMASERPAHRVKLNGFFIDEHGVTNAEFRKFVEATKYVTTAEK